MRTRPRQQENKPVRAAEQVGENLDSRASGPDLSQRRAQHQRHDLSRSDHCCRLSGAGVKPTAVCDDVRSLCGQTFGDCRPRWGKPHCLTGVGQPWK
jgi:hypothetical protein